MAEGLRDRIVRLWDLVELPDLTLGQRGDIADTFIHMIHQPEIDRLRARAETAEAEASRWRDSSTKGGRLITRLRRENARLHTAWWSARIGRAQARAEVTAMRPRLETSKRVGELRDATAKLEQDAAALHERAERQEVELVQLRVAAQAETRAANRWMAEANQAEAAIGRVRALVQANSDRAECGAGWLLDPAAVLAALDQPEASPIICCRCHDGPVAQEGDLCESCDVEITAINQWAANLDPRKEAT